LSACFVEEQNCLATGKKKPDEAELTTKSSDLYRLTDVMH